MDLDQVPGGDLTMVAPHLVGPRSAGPWPLPAGVRVGDQELATLPLAGHEFHGEWNSTLHPAA